MLKPAEDIRTRKLIYKCEQCKFSRAALNPCIQKHVLKKSTTTRLELIETDLVNDKTLPRAHDTDCPKCHGKEAVYFMSRAGGRDSDMALIFLCVNPNCLTKWIFNS
jgi:DNA-directed RNA polymerase II subunit RPB9